MTRIVIITRGFPYLNAEAFVEPEAPYWERPGCEVVVMPWAVDDNPRRVPDSVTLDHTLAKITRRQKNLSRIACLASPLFWRELDGLRRRGRLSAATAKEALRCVSGALVVRRALKRWIADNGPIDVVYSYWWDVWTYGAQLLRGRGIGHVVTRAHGYDLYESRHPSGHLGLKRQLGPRLDQLLAISRDGLETARRDYGVPESRSRLSPLGVELPGRPAGVSEAGHLEIVSVASMVPLKRIDLLIGALDLLCSDHPELQVGWTHFGDGPLRTDLEAAAAALRRHPSLRFQLPGNVPNEQVRRHFAEHPVDLFVNTSSTEGVPVSIMEAMAFGIPALATDVGGTSDLVPHDGPGGQLLAPGLTAHDLAQALWNWHERAKDLTERQAAREVVEERHDRDRNYPGLMDLLIETSEAAR